MTTEPDWTDKPGRHLMGAAHNRAVVDEAPEHHAARERTPEEDKAVGERELVDAWHLTPEQERALREMYPSAWDEIPDEELKLDIFRSAVEDVVDELTDLLVQKQADYGSGNILHPPIDPKLALLVRMSDKLARLTNLLNSGGEPRNEPLRDSFIDLAGYAIIGLMLVDGTFPE